MKTPAKGASAKRRAGHVGSKLPTEKMMGWAKGASAAGVKALRPYRGGPPGRP